ncbi:MAG: hypothetical protein GY888_29680, partial [Planctomycetaceae bacterium]|nr:hypothetical protein [Planctomycetaceae bacterium]
MIDTLMQVLDEPPVSPRQLNPTVDRDLETICLKCLEKVGVRRYHTAHDLSVELKRFLDGHPIQARPVGAVSRFWRWCCRRPKLAAAWSLIAGLLLFLGVAGPLAAIRQAHLKTMADEAAGESEEAARKYRREQLRANQEAATAIKQRQRADQQAQRAIRQELLATQQATVAEQGLYDTRMILAQAALKNADIRSMRQLLDFYQQGRAGKDYRGFEWYYLHEQLHQESLDIDANPGFAIMDVAIRPGARQIASLGGNGFLRIWHPRTGKMICQVWLGSNRGYSMDYSDDGRWIAIGSNSGEIELRDADTLELGKKVKAGSVALSKIDLLPGHNKCVVRDTNGAILSVQLDTGDVKLIQEAIVRSEYRNQPVYQQRRFACSRDGKFLAFNDSQQNVAYWDLELGKLKYLVKGTRVSTRSQIAPALGLSSDGKWLVHGDRRGEVSVWRASDGVSYYRYHDHFKAIEQVALTAG